MQNGRWWIAFWLSALLPAITYYPAFALGATWIPASRFLPQSFTTQIALWALINTAITLALLPLLPKRPTRKGVVGQSILIAVATVAVGYVAMWLADVLFKIDFRFWVVALKLPSATQWMIMADEDVGKAELPLQLLQQLDHRGRNNRIEGRRDLVAQDKRRFSSKRPSEIDALLLTA